MNGNVRLHRPPDPPAQAVHRIVDRVRRRHPPPPPIGEITERLFEVTCPRCAYDGDPVRRTRALRIERAHVEALQIDRGYPSGQSRTWREACYRKGAVEIDAAAPNMSVAAESLIVEAHAEGTWSKMPKP